MHSCKNFDGIFGAVPLQFEQVTAPSHNRRFPHHTGNPPAFQTVGLSWQFGVEERVSQSTKSWREFFGMLEI